VLEPTNLGAWWHHQTSDTSLWLKREIATYRNSIATHPLPPPYTTPIHWQWQWCCRHGCGLFGISDCFFPRNTCTSTSVAAWTMFWQRILAAPLHSARLMGLGSWAGFHWFSFPCVWGRERYGALVWNADKWRGEFRIVIHTTRDVPILGFVSWVWRPIAFVSQLHLVWQTDTTLRLKCSLTWHLLRSFPSQHASCLLLLLLTHWIFLRFWNYVWLLAVVWTILSE